MSDQFPVDSQSTQYNLIKFAQCLAGMTDPNDPWSQIGQVIFHFFEADVIGFLYPDEDCQWKSHYWSLRPGVREKDIITPAFQQTAVRVLESGFLVCETMDLDGPCQVAMIPLRLNGKIAEMLLIGHHTAASLPEELQNIYSALAGLAGETITRLTAFVKLRQHDQRLQEMQELLANHAYSLVAVNKDLDQVNKQLHRETAERQRTEQALHESEQEKSAILNGLQEVEVFLLDPQMRIIWTNAKASLPCNRQDAGLRGLCCYKVLQGRNAPCPGCTAWAALRHKRFQEGEITLPDGRAVLAHSNPLKNQRGEITSLVHVAMDITRRKMVERALIKREAQLRGIVENALEIIYTLTPEGMISYASPRWTELNGHEGPDLLGRSFVSFLHPSDRTTFQSYFDAVAAGEEGNQRIEFRLENRNGQWRWYSTTLAPVKDAHVRLKEFVGIAEDITERKRIEEEMCKAKEAAEAATRAKNEFLTNISHEIRTPMTSILGFAEILLENLNRPEDVVAANTIKRSGEYLLRLINDILDLSKIEAGRLLTEQAKCAPRELIEEVVTMMKLRAAAKGLPLILEFAGPIPQTIQTDAIRFRQILVNLIGNAVKFTEQGQVRVIVRLMENQRPEPLLSCKIIDTGIGMSQEQLAVLFEPFTLGNAAANRKHTGLGLGLALSKRLAAMLGGDIAFESTPRQGSTFVVTVATGSLEGVHMMEITDMPEDQGAPVEAPPVPVTQKLSGNILLAEDGLDNQRLIGLILRKAGANVIVVNNGKEALEKVIAEQNKLSKQGVSSSPFGIILMDMQMPEMDGYEATWRLREMGYAAPIIAITAHAMSHDREKCLEAGCNEYLTKPINRELLLSTMARYTSAAEEKSLQEVPAWTI